MTNNSSIYNVDHLLESKLNFKDDEYDRDSIDELFSDDDVNDSL